MRAYASGASESIADCPDNPSRQIPSDDNSHVERADGNDSKRENHHDEKSTGTTFSLGNGGRWFRSQPVM